MYILIILIALIALCFGVTSIRQRLISQPVFDYFRKTLPPLSAVERQAMTAGSAWWDVQLFRGKPDWHQLLNFKAPQLTAAEQAFIDNEVEQLLTMLNDFTICEQQDLPAPVWTFLKEQGFFALVLPETYGGKNFSPVAVSTIVSLVAARSLSAAVTVMVPNSLGPGELLLKYGTPEQQQRWLPGLASGQELPCFALTAPTAGSDAGAIPDAGTVCYGEYEGEQVLGINLNFDKRYITLAPVATVVGLAFKLYDPEQLLGEQSELGITCALLPADHPGVEIGARHRPMNLAFMNGTVRGTDVFIPLDWVIGGRECVGKGWQMLVECLSTGRGISLPAIASGEGHLCARTTGAYSYVRQQFGRPIGECEGVQEALARIGGLTYTLEGTRLMTAQALADGESPTVITAVAKYHMTEIARQLVNDAMDVHAGRGIQLGENNYLGLIYSGLPVAITVEGANILTRSLMIFGLTATRSHPFIAAEMAAAENTNPEQGLADFDQLLMQHLRYGAGNALASLWQGLTFARFNRTPVSGPTAGYYKHLTRYSRALAIVADITMLALGGELKKRELLSARLGDVLSHLYMASAVLKHYEQSGRQQCDLPYVHYALQHHLHAIEHALHGVLTNFPVTGVRWLLQGLIFPLGRHHHGPDDKTIKAVSKALMTPGPGRERLTHLCRVEATDNNPAADVEQAFLASYKARKIYQKLASAQHLGQLPKGPWRAQWRQQALDQQLLTAAEIDELEQAEQYRQQAIAVDEFAVKKIA